MLKRMLGFIGVLLLLTACEQKQSFDTETELAKLEETRTKFQTLLKEKRYQEMRSVMAEGAETTGPVGEGWLEMRRLGQERGTFPYDSIRMHPKETVIVNDTLAYDYGYSNVYYTNEEGEVVILQDTFIALIKKEKDGVWRLWREVASGKVDAVLGE